ncbi:Apoptosis-inducing factor 1 [Erysiphe necator]|nr:Apoptosis-inducing factor 1 [Erysiphe necator]
MSQDFKLKGLNKLDLNPGEKIEVEVEGVENGKVLLCNVNGEISAIGSKCTHYGAPMVKGVLTLDGRITCPWHGACFKASNGDIENAPALDALPTFKLFERNGAVFISGNKEAIASSRRKPNIKVSSIANDMNVVIVGGGSAALATIEALRENGFNGIIKMITDEGYLPIDRTKLSKALVDDPSKIFLRDEDWFRYGSIEVIKDEVTSIDPLLKIVVTRGGDSHMYNKLVLATGGTPRRLLHSGFNELCGIFPLRTAHHTKAINKAIGSKGKKIVIIGSSFIGLEVANAVSRDNDTTVVGRDEAPLARIMGKEIGQLIQKAFEKNGVKFHLAAEVIEAFPSQSDSSKVGGVQLKDGTKLEADLVILGAGVTPATSYLKNNNIIKLLKDSSIKTNEYFVVDGQQDIYAVGDIATFPYHGPAGNGTPLRIEHWNVAQNAGRIAAAHITMRNDITTTFIPIFWSALGSQLRYCGNPSNGWDGTIIKGQPEELKFVVYYTKGETVVAVGSIGFDPVVAQASELMRRGDMPSKTELLNKIDILQIGMPISVKI